MKTEQTPERLPMHHRKRRQHKSFFLATMVLAVVSTSSSSCGRPNSMMMAEATPASAAIGALKSIDYRYFVAGGTCAAFSHGITTPIDVVKTRLQANPEKYKGKGLIGATVQICRDKEEGGASTLLSGLGPTVLGYGIEGAMKFGAYEATKPIFRALLGDGEKRKVLAFIMASILAGSIASVLLVPMESLRIKQVTDATYQKDTILTGLPRIFRDDGFWVTMSGVWAMLAKQVPYTFGKQVSFDLVAKSLYSVLDSLSETKSLRLRALSPAQWKWIVSLLSAFCASIAACLCSQPGDMILTETYNNSNPGSNNKNKNNKRKPTAKTAATATAANPNAPGNFGAVVSSIYGKGGLAEFFRGTQARLVHVGMIITSQLMVYDLVKQLLGLPATGSH